MKKNVVGIFICLMLITSLFTLVTPAENKVKDKELIQPLTIPLQVDVPIWEIGNQWVYRIDDVNIKFNDTNTLFDMSLSIDTLPLTVRTLDETSYTLAFETKISGNAKLDMDRGDGPINISITFSNLKFSGDIIFEKATLGIKGLLGSFNGRFWVKINEQPIVPLPPLPSLPVKIKANLVSDFSDSITPLMFPLNDSMIWNLTETNLTLNGEIRSPWLYLVLFINSFYEFLPPEIAALLPVVDIKEAFTTLGRENIISIPMIAGAFYCMNTETITVPARTYDAYNITIMDGMARCFYAPDAGNIIKLTGNIEDLIPFITNINMELLSTTYS